MNEVFISFQKSLGRLAEVLGMDKTMITRDAAIKRFEFTSELAWKSIQHFLRAQNIVCRSPRECLEAAFKFGLIADNPLWLRLMEDRNLTVHTYNEAVAEKIYSHLQEYLKLFNELKDTLDKKG